MADRPHRMTASPPAAPALRLHDVALSYPTGEGTLQVLRHLSMQVERGQSLAIVGQSGSGKTSLLLLMAGLERPSAGRIDLDGIDLATLAPDDLADLRRDRLGIVFQSFHLLPSLTALDNVALPLRMAGASDAFDRARAMLDRVGLQPRASHLPAQLSGGEQQRVAIARALVHRPALVLADEPTGNLDEHTGERVRELLLDLHRDAGTTLVLVTHDASFAARCDRVLRLSDGRLHEETRRASPQARPAAAPSPRAHDDEPHDAPVA